MKMNFESLYFHISRLVRPRSDSVKCLPYEPSDLSSDPELMKNLDVRHTSTVQGAETGLNMRAHIYNPRGKVSIGCEAHIYSPGNRQDWM